MLKEALISLLNVAGELDLRMFSICKGNIDAVVWPTIHDLLCKIFYKTEIKIFICHNSIPHQANVRRL